MELDELHVDELGARAQRQGMPVRRVLPGIRGDLVGLAHAARGQHDRLGAERDEASRLAPVSESAHDAAAIHQEPGHGALHVDFQALMDAVILQCADHLEAGAVSDVREPRRGMPAEVPLQDPSVLGAVEDRAPVLELADAVGGLLRVELGHAPVVEQLPAEHRVLEVDLPGIVGVHVRERRGHAPFRHHRVRFSEQGLADHADFGTLRGRLDGRAKTRAAGSDHQHVHVVGLEAIGRHRSLTSCQMPIERRRT